VLRAVSIIVAPALHTIFVTARSRLSTKPPATARSRCSIFPPWLPARRPILFFFLFFFACLPASPPPPSPSPSPPTLPPRRAPIFFRPFARAAKRRKNAIPFCRARISGRSLRRFGSRSHPPPLHPRLSRSRAFVLSTSVATTAAAAAAARRERALLSAPPPRPFQSFALEMSGANFSGAIARESPLDGRCRRSCLFNRRTEGRRQRWPADSANAGYGATKNFYVPKKRYA